MACSKEERDRFTIELLNLLVYAMFCMNRSHHFIAQSNSFNRPTNMHMKSKIFLAFYLFLALAIHSETGVARGRSGFEKATVPKTMHPTMTTATPLSPQTLSSPQLVWQQLDFQTLPSPRLGPALTLNPINKVALLFGGSNSFAGMLNDLWLTNGRAWLQFQTPHAPAARAGASMIYDEARQEAVLFGGVTYTGTLMGDTWIFNGIDWIQQEPLDAPFPRANASIAYDASRDLTILFGGQANTGGKYWEALNETWAWDGANWQQQFPPTLPPVRWGANMAYDRARRSIVLFGGAAGGALRDDTWLWDGAVWIEQHPLHHPAGRANFGMAYDESRQQVILFGGQTSVGANPPETWAWDGQDWIELHTYQAPPSDLAYGAQLVYLPSLQTVSMFGDFRQKIDNPDGTATFIERTEVWALNSRYLIFSPLFTRE